MVPTGKNCCLLLEVLRIFSGGQPLASGDCVSHQHCNCHGTDPSRNGCDVRGFGGHGFEIDIPYKPVTGFRRGIINTIDPDIDHYRSVLYMVGPDRFWSADRGNQDVGTSGNFSQIFCSGMGYGDSSVST